MIRVIHENTRIAYNLIAEKYHLLFWNELDDKPFDRAYLDKFAGFFAPASKIIDAGCGPTAHIGRYLHDKGLKVTGIDISERCIEIATECNPMMDFLRLDLLDWKPDSNSIDGIVAYYSIIYSPKQEVGLLLDNFNRALVPGGRLLLAVKKGSFEGYQDEVLGINVHSYFAEYQEREVENIVAKSGFRIDELITRSPYRDEIQNERIYCLCSRVNLKEEISKDLIRRR